CPPRAPVAQWIEQRFPKPRAQVRFLPGASDREASSEAGSRDHRQVRAAVGDRLRLQDVYTEGANRIREEQGGIVGESTACITSYCLNPETRRRLGRAGVAEVSGCC